MSYTPVTEHLVPKLKLDTLLTMLSRGLRLNGRRLDELRPISIVTDYISNADGSALVKLGNTQVLVGVKLEIGTPFSDTPNEGNLIVNAEFVPAASPVFEPGPPDENAIELARVIDRGIRESKAVDLSKLVIIPGKRVWNLWVDIYVLDHDGNLVDASSIGVLAALLTTKLPKVDVKEGGEVTIDRNTKTEQLVVRKCVTTVSISKIGEYLLVDPDLEEESLMDAKLVVSVTDDGLIAGLQKSGSGYFSEDEVLKAINIALGKGRELIDFVKNNVVQSANTSAT